MRTPRPLGEGERRMRLFRCGYCGSLPGEACVKPGGQVRRDSHGHRWQQATDCGLLPLTDSAPVAGPSPSSSQ